MTKILLMVNHIPLRSFGERNDDIREVEAFVAGGLEGVFAIYRIKEEEPNVYYFASGDDGNWWRISNGLHSDWLDEVYLVLAEAMLERDREKRNRGE